MITIQEDQVTPFLNKMASKLKNTKPLMQELSQQMVNAVRENFATEGVSLLGHKWQALKKSTIKSKQKRNRPLSILRDSDKLQSSIYGNATDKEAIVGVAGRIPYAAIHQFGGESYHHPLTRTMRFRLTRGGELQKQDNYPNLVRFAKAGHKNQVNYTMTQNAYLVKIPSRPYLGMGQKQRNLALLLINKFFYG
jgi:phage virion morphogenesis protein